jgi:5-methylcytosine-specific restriction endonuclease McrA
MELKQYYIKLKRKINEAEKYYKEYPDKLTPIYKEKLIKAKERYNKEYLKLNGDKKRKAAKIYRNEHKKDIKEKNKKYWKEHLKERHENSKRYYNKNYEKIHKWQMEYAKNRHKTDLKYNLRMKISKAINQSLRYCKKVKSNKNGRHWEDLVGYKLNDLIIRLLSTMPEGYTWEDVKRGELHIDHIIPISVFNFTKPEHIDFKRCWELENLRLLSKKDNLIKNAKLTKPFQPSLLLEEL